jgi:hypothetical protein
MGTDIHQCAWNGDLDVVRVFLETNAALVNAVDKNDHGDEYRPLHYAAYQGHAELCKDLLSRGAHIDAVTGSGCTALFFASQQGRKKVVKLLLKQRASASIVEKECGLGPLDVADSDKIRSLFRKVVNADGKPRYGRPKRVEAPRAELVASKKKSPSMNSATPSKPSAAAKNTVSIKVYWDPVPIVKGKDALPVSGYIVRVKNQDTDRDEKIVDVVASEDGGEQTARIGGLPEGVPMIVQIAAVNGLGRGKYSEPSNLVAAARRPGKMRKPTILEDVVTPNSVSVSWVDSAENLPAGVTKVEVQLRRVCDSEEYTKTNPATPGASAAESQTSSNRVHLPGNEFCPYFQVKKVTKKTVCKCVTSEAFTTGCIADISEGRHVAEVKGLLSGSVYEFCVRSVNVAGSSELSDSALGETLMFSSSSRSRSSNHGTRQVAKAGDKSRTAPPARAPAVPKARAPASRSRGGSRTQQQQQQQQAEPFTPEGKEESFRGRRGRFKVNHVGQDEF